MCDDAFLIPKRPPARDRKYLDWVALIGICAACGARNIKCEPMHVRMGADGGAGMKPSDTLTVVPGCHSCHHAQHNGCGERAFWDDVGSDPRPLASALRACYPDPTIAQRTVLVFINRRGFSR